MKQIGIGVIDKACAGWTSAGEYSRVQVGGLLAALRGRDDATLTVVTHRAERFSPPGAQPSDALSYVRPYEVAWLSMPQRILKRAWGWSGRWRDPRLGQWERWCRQNGIDVLLSFTPWDWWHPTGIATACSIPDFQHRHLPEYFGEDELAFRDRDYRDQAEKTDLAILHSRDAARDFADVIPHCADAVRIYHFPSVHCFREPVQVEEQCAVRKHYNLERGFMLVMNQFWAHKNHRVVVEAMGRLAKRGACPQVVIIGQTSDSRDPSGNALSALLGRIAELGLEGRIKVLGFVPAAHRDALLAGCQALVQPSRFEGWNTAIEDAKAVGCPVLASDLAVHREQLEAPFGFFDVEDAEALADLMRRAADELPPGGERPGVEAALESARTQMLVESNKLLDYCREAVSIAAARRP